MADIDESKLVSTDINRPTACDKCGGSMKYRGIGEYSCEKCNNIMYDDYGKVRNYLESHPGATQVEVAQATGVGKTVIRRFLREDKIEIAPNSLVFMYCERCKSPIRSGRYCDRCAAAVSTNDIADKRSNLIKGFGKAPSGQSGARRFER